MSFQQMITEELRIDPNRARMVEAYVRLITGQDDPPPPAVLREHYESGISALIDGDPEGAERLAVTFGL
jgi:hypothetical protein